MAPRGTAAAAVPGVAKSGMVLRGRWKLGKQIAEGACGQVFEVSDVTGTQQQHPWVAKVTPLPSPSTSGKRKNKKDDALKKNADTLYMEQLVYKNYLMGVARIPALPDTLAYGEDQGLRFLVMQRLGRTLMEDFEARGKHYTPAMLGDYGGQMLSSLQILHERQLLFVDVKPENFMLGPRGTAQESTVYMMDFGLVEKYVAAGGHRVDSGGGGGGTPLFMSLSCQQGASPGRRDDLEALGFMLIMLLRGGNLPWADASSDADCLAKKKATSLTDLVRGLPGGEHLKSFIELARSTPYDAIPDYKRFQSFLDRLAKTPDSKSASGTSQEQKKKRAAAGGGGAAAAKSGGSSAAKASEADEEEDETRGGDGEAKRGRRAARTAKDSGKSAPASTAAAATATTPSSNRSSLSGGLFAIAATAGRFLMRSVRGTGGGRDDPVDDDDVIDLTLPDAPSAGKAGRETVIIDDDDEEEDTQAKRTRRGGAVAGRRGRGAAKEAPVVEVEDEDGEAGKSDEMSVSSEDKDLRLDVRDGPHRGQSFLIRRQDGKAVYAGSSAECVVSLVKDTEVRPKHCKIELKKEARTQSLKVVPVGAADIQVNKVAVGKTGRLVFPGDLIHIGGTTLLVQLA